MKTLRLRCMRTFSRRARLLLRTTQMIGSWTDPDYQPCRAEVLVIGLARIRRTSGLRDSHGKELQKRKITPFWLERDSQGAPFDTTGGRQYCRRTHRPGDHHPRRRALQGDRVRARDHGLYAGPAYRGFFPYYYSSWTTVTTPGYMRITRWRRWRPTPTQ